MMLPRPTKGTDSTSATSSDIIWSVNLNALSCFLSLFVLLAVVLSDVKPE